MKAVRLLSTLRKWNGEKKKKEEINKRAVAVQLGSIVTHNLYLTIYKMNELSLRFENHIQSEESALCTDMFPYNTIVSRGLTILVAQTSFYILIGEYKEVAFQAASTTADRSEVCSHGGLLCRAALCPASNRQVPKAARVQSQIDILSSVDQI